MTRSIFDPTGGETEHSGSRNMGPRADNISHLPPELVEGHAEDDNTEELDPELNSPESPQSPQQLGGEQIQDRWQESE